MANRYESEEGSERNSGSCSLDPVVGPDSPAPMRIDALEKGICRNFQRYERTSDMVSSHRLGYVQKHRVGEFFWTHEAVPGLAFPTRKRAMMTAARSLNLSWPNGEFSGGGAQHE